MELKTRPGINFRTRFLYNMQYSVHKDIKDYVRKEFNKLFQKFPIKGRMPGTCVPGIVMKKLFVSLLHWRLFKSCFFSVQLMIEV
jgi:hypothetical protein